MRSSSSTKVSAASRATTAGLLLDALVHAGPPREARGHGPDRGDDQGVGERRTAASAHAREQLNALMEARAEAQVAAAQAEGARGTV
eukprot:643888-Prymnesium_polylepis.2